ncbi:MAG TPA: AbrB/MazE/SpoVT family DNA-binding domain-containing protein [Nostocaceae cyanobacterium]|nr:AbrB/MazE/SpoVT family DNA-binding domain-containing protein [Nostocaceae cyanobacterium]
MTRKNNQNKINKSHITQSDILQELETKHSTEVYIKEDSDTIFTSTKANPWQYLIDSLDNFSDDFMNTREQPILETRENF